jgi:hypothetical protein
MSYEYADSEAGQHKAYNNGTKINKRSHAFCCRWNRIHPPPPHLYDDISKAFTRQTERRKTKRQKGGSPFTLFTVACRGTGDGAVSNDSKIAWTSILFLFHSCNKTIFTIC